MEFYHLYNTEEGRKSKIVLKFMHLSSNVTSKKKLKSTNLVINVWNTEALVRFFPCSMSGKNLRTIIKTSIKSDHYFIVK